MRIRLALLAMCLAPAAFAAQEAPLWEAGMGVAALYFPEYRGSSRARTYVLPAPYFVYRGEIFKADRQGMRGLFLRSDRVDLNMSVGASLPVDSEDNALRTGMPDLEPSFELGPSVDVMMWRSADERARIELRFPVRGAITIESRPRYVGTQFFPHANLDVAGPFGHAGWNLGMLAGPVFTDSRYNRYYYGVEPEFATATRPAYQPGGGYGGMQFIVALSKRFPKFWIGGFARYDTLNGAEFAASPLVDSKRYVAGGIAISWIFAESPQRVPVDPGGQRR